MPGGNLAALLSDRGSPELQSVTCPHIAASPAQNDLAAIGLNPALDAVLHRQLRRFDPLTLEPAFQQGVHQARGEQGAFDGIGRLAGDHHLRHRLDLEAEMIALRLGQVVPATERFRLGAGPPGERKFLTMPR